MMGFGTSAGLVAVEIAHEGLDAALVAQLDALLLGVAAVGQDDRTPEFRKASSRSRCSSVPSRTRSW
jgi:hypothetical protein